MKKIDIKNNLKSALEKSTPDCFYKINNGAYVNQIDFNVEDIKESKKKTLNFNMKYALAISACLLIMIIGFSTYYVPVNDIYIDVNPSIEIKTNMFDKVIVVNAKNDDGTSIVNSVDVKNKDIETAIDDIMNEMISQGYIKSELTDNAILISVNAKSEEQAKEISDSIDKSVNNNLNENNISAVVMKQELNSMKDLQALSKETGVSVGKLQFIQKMIDKNNEKTDASSLYNLKIKELLAYAEKNKISTEDLVDEIEEIINNMDDDDDDNDGDDNYHKNKIDNVKDKNNKNNKNDKIDKNDKGKDKKEDNKKENNKKDKNDDKDDFIDDSDDDEKYEKDKKEVKKEDKQNEKEIKKKDHENKKSEQKDNNKDKENEDNDHEKDDDENEDDND